ncbi:MAG: HlyD family efflux transporter periplasmic adaptor subunit [Planctomycetota bacterium]
MMKAVVRAVVCVFLLLLGAGGGVLVYLSLTAAAPSDTCVATMDKVRRSLHGSGRVEGGPEATLSFGRPGRLDKVNVKEGQPVVLNETLAEMNPAEALKQITQAQAALNEAEAEFEVAKAPPPLEVIHQAEEKYEQAKSAAKSAALKLQVLQHPDPPLAAKEWEVADAELAVKDAQIKLERTETALKKLKAGPNLDDVEVSKRKWNVAITERENARNLLAQWKPQQTFVIGGGPPPKETKADLEAALARAEDQEKVANAEYDRVKRGPKPEDIRPQELDVETAKLALDSANAKKARLEKPEPPPPPPAHEIEQAKLALEQAQAGERFAKAALEDANRGPDQNKVRAVEALKERRASELAMLNLFKEGLKLRAPFDGQVAKRHVEPGATVAAFVPIISIVDFSQKRVRAEYDVKNMGDLKAGLPVTISSRAFHQEEKLEGKVLELGHIGPRKVTVEDPAVTRGGEIVEVLIGIEEPKSEVKKELYNKVLQIGLPVETEVVLEERQNVLVVPRSYVAQENGNEYVWIVERDLVSGKAEAPKQRAVKCGLRDEHFVEIIEGLNVGDTITRPKPRN